MKKAIHNRSTIPLYRILDKHDRYSHLTRLVDNIGDGVLFAKNPVFRSVRELSVSFGCEFVSNDLYGYFAWPLISLPSILKSRQIPYRRTASAIRLLESTRPRFFNSNATQLVEFQGNAILHESAHVIADQIWIRCEPKLNRLNQWRRIILRYSLGEAFANATELLAMVHTDSDEDRYLLSLNSYWDNLPNIKTNSQKILKEIGPFSLCCWITVCFLFSNLCQDRKFAALRSNMLEICRISSKLSRHSQEILDFYANEALSLNIDFRIHTARMFYSSLGIPRDAIELMHFDFIDAINGDLGALDCLNKLTAIMAQTFEKNQRVAIY